MQGKRAVAHVMLDAGMTRQTAQDLKLVKEGVKLVFSRPQGELRVVLWLLGKPGVVDVITLLDLNSAKIRR